MKEFDFIVIGAGAAGLFAAIRASENGKTVAIVEKMNRAGRKLLITGKGRCNITNSAEIDDFITHVYPDGRFLYSAFKQYYSYDVLSFFEECGVAVTLERGGRYFPTSEKAVDIVDALYNRAINNGVKFFFNSSVQEIIVEDLQVSGILYTNHSQNKSLKSRNVLICTGGKSYPLTGSSGDGYKFAKHLGHNIIKPIPALVPLVVKENYAKQMQGLTLKNINAKLFIDDKLELEEFGDLLFTHFGLSGPVILTLSRSVVKALENNSKVVICIDFKPALDNEKLDRRLQRDIDNYGKKKIINIYKNWLPQKAISVFMDIVSIDPDKPANQITAKERENILQSFKGLKFNVLDYKGFNDAIITSGGVDLKEVNQRTMESKIITGLYFAGEILDLDAETGGYNLQIAFSTGWLAGNSIL